MREIDFYRTASGRCPVEEFLDSLSGKTQKTPQQEIMLAETRKKDYFNRRQ